jgi:hypothetical protein
MQDTVKKQHLSTGPASPFKLRTALWEGEAPSEPKPSSRNLQFLKVGRVAFWMTLAAVFCCTAGFLSAGTFGNFYYTEDGTSISITGVVTPPVGEVNIPPLINGKPVAFINGYAFQNCVNPISVTIPSSVIYIAEYAFYNCKGLTSVTIPSSVTYIRGFTFQDCSNLTSVTIPTGVTRIGNWAFKGCSGLTSVTIPSTVTNIDYSAFSDCTGLASLTISSGVQIIGNGAFSSCINLTSVVIPSSVVIIESGAFRYCYGLSSISVDVSNHNFSSTEGVLFNKLQTTLIQCPATKSGAYTIPSTVSSIEDDAFSHCSGLTSVTIPSSVTGIGKNAFFNCSGLTSITIPSSVIGIGSAAFAGCTGLTSVIIPVSVTGVADETFRDCAALTSVTIPASVTGIGKNAFSNCGGLTSVTIPNSVTSIGDWSFSSCRGLSSVTIPSSVSSIGNYAFWWCSSLTSAEFLGNAPTMGSSVFAGTGAGFSVKYQNGSTGFTSPTWMGYPSLALGVPQTGVLQVSISPAGAVTGGAQWQVDGGTWQASGATSTGLPVGTYTVSYKAVSGWDSPPDSSVTVNANQTTAITGTYSVQVGALEVNITPTGAVTAGAQWRVDGGTWVGGGSVTDGLSLGSHTVSFKAVSGWTAPADMIVTVNANQKTAITGTYALIPTGALQVSIGPAGAVTAGAQWQFDGGTWQASDATISGLSLGNHTVSFKTVSTWNTPADVIVPITANQTAAVTSTYVPQTGAYQVNIDPAGAVAAGAQWRIDAGDWQTSGTILSGLAVGAHTLSFKAASGWITPGNSPIIIYLNQTKVVTTTYDVEKGSLQANITPAAAVTAGAQWRVDGGTWRTSGTTLSGIAIGTHTVSFKAVTGWGTPTDVPVTVNANQTTIVAAEFYDSKITYTDNGSSITITGWSGAYGALVIPSVINGKPVTAIGNSAFSGSSITSVAIPSSVTSIGDSAFYSCTGLTSVTLPSSVTSIGDHAFSFCSGLTSVTIPANVISIGIGPFSGCSALTTISVDAANPNYSSVLGVLFNKLQTLLIQCPSKSGTYVIPSSVTSIGDNAFFRCSGLTSVAIPSRVTSIGPSAFSGCSGLTTMAIPFGVTSIDKSVFSSCTGLTSVTIPDSVTSIGSRAFYGCSALTSMNISENVTSIGSYAFYSCSALTSINIPNSVTSIGSYAFCYCSGLTSVTLSSGISSIEMSAFAYCVSLTSAVIPAGVVSINKSAFFECMGLTSVTIKSGVSSIGDTAFKNCSGLTSVTIPASVTVIGVSAFSFCSVLTSAEFLGNAPSVGLGVFDGNAIGFSVKYYSGTTGFTSPKWNGYVSVNLGTLPLSIATATLSAGKIGVSYNQPLQATGGSPPYTWDLVSGSLPPLLVLGGNGTITGMPATATTANFTVRVTGGDSQSITGNITLTVTSPYATWQGIKFTTSDITAGLTTMPADFDGDGTPNLLEYAFATDPKVAAASPVAVNVSGNNLQISFPCDATCTDITYTVQSSSTLVTNSWTDIAKSISGTTTVPVESLSTVSDSGTGTRTVTVTDSTALPTGGQRFLRVKLTAP